MGLLVRPRNGPGPIWIPFLFFGSFFCDITSHTLLSYIRITRNLLNIISLINGILKIQKLLYLTSHQRFLPQSH